jgi:NADH/NAD ratio-sensing transcriptional regulator Rex
MNSLLNRRDFLKNTALGGTGLLILQNCNLARSYQANEKLNIALIGVGGRGRWFVDTMPNLNTNVVAMCDVNERKASLSFEEIPQAKKYFDYRKMLKEMDKQIEAVVIAVPDHSHASASAAAMKMGKHVLCEKPLTLTVGEARAIRLMAAKCNVATQMGNQGTSSEAFRRAVELVEGGVIGDVREVHAWNTGGGSGDMPVPTDEHPVPDYLHWDLWLGPARFRPYNSRWVSSWHDWRDFGTGNLGNWASHTMNLPFKALRLDTLWDPQSDSSAKNLIKLEPEVSGVHKHSLPKWEIIRYDFPARGDMPPVRINWYNGPGQAPGPRKMIEQRMERPLDWGDAGEKKWADHSGCLLIGNKGMIHSTGHNMSFTLLPTDKFENFEGPPKTLPRSRGHEREWLEACKGGPQAMSSFNYAGRLAEFVLLGNVSTLVGSPIEFDPIAMKIVNNAEADQALRYEYRDGWSL